MRLNLAARGEISEERLEFARQIDVAGMAVTPEPDDSERGYYEFAQLLDVKSQIEAHGLKFETISLPPWKWCYKWMLGLPGRDEQIENLHKTIRNMGAVGIPILIYNMHVLRFYRTSRYVPERGGAVATAFDMELAKNAPLMVSGQHGVDTRLIPASHRRPISDEDMWDNLTYFLKAVVPVAEEAGVQLALHPDDPPVPSIGGVARIMRSPEAFRRAIEIVPSDYNGLKFCVGCFSEMGADVAEEIRYFGNRKKIFFVDFRNIKGTVDDFVETFPDDGKEDMLELMKALKEVGFDGPISPDHALRIVDDTEWGHRYWAYAIGHMKGLIQAANSSS